MDENTVNKIKFIINLTHHITPAVSCCYLTGSRLFGWETFLDRNYPRGMRELLSSIADFVNQHSHLFSLYGLKGSSPVSDMLFYNGMPLYLVS